MSDEVHHPQEAVELPMGHGAQSSHVSVLADEVMTFLAPVPGGVYVDVTLGAGGHSLLIAKKVGLQGRVLSLDHDASMVERARGRLTGYPVTLVHARYDSLPEILESQGMTQVDGVLADLGICSDQLDDPDRGFTFQRSGPIDMRMDQSRGESALDLVQRMSEYDLANLIFHYGEERFSRRIARTIVQARSQGLLKTTQDLAYWVRRSIPRKDPSGIDPATRTFQALRIAVNDEIRVLERFLDRLPECLKVGGVAVVISFHSLEDRLVKTAFRQDPPWENLTRKPVLAGELELKANPRSRSAKLRAARKIDPLSPQTKNQKGAR